MKSRFLLMASLGIHLFSLPGCGKKTNFSGTNSTTEHGPHSVLVSDVQSVNKQQLVSCGDELEPKITKSAPSLKTTTESTSTPWALVVAQNCAQIKTIQTPLPKATLHLILNIGPTMQSNHFNSGVLATVDALCSTLGDRASGWKLVVTPFADEALASDKQQRELCSGQTRSWLGGLFRTVVKEVKAGDTTSFVTKTINAGFQAVFQEAALLVPQNSGDPQFLWFANNAPSAVLPEFQTLPLPGVLLANVTNIQPPNVPSTYPTSLEQLEVLTSGSATPVRRLTDDAGIPKTDAILSTTGLQSTEKENCVLVGWTQMGATANVLKEQIYSDQAPTLGFESIAVDPSAKSIQMKRICSLDKKYKSISVDIVQ